MALTKKVNNIVATVEDNKLIITIDLTKDLGISKSGKNTLVASTKGNVAIEGTDVILGLNAYTPIE